MRGATGSASRFHTPSSKDLPGQLVTSARMINCNFAIPVWLRRNRLYLGHHSAPHKYLAELGQDSADAAPGPSARHELHPHPAGGFPRGQYRLTGGLPVFGQG